MSDISIIRPIEVVLSFIIFSSLIMINVILTKKLILEHKRGLSANAFRGFGSKIFILFVYVFKFFIYAGAIFFVDKLIGITFSFILGVLLSLFVFLIISLTLYYFRSL